MIIYIWGNLTTDNFTPRLGKDTVGRPGQAAGLSASSTIPRGRKSQGIDTARLVLPLRAIPDVPNLGGISGHISLAPVDEKGEVDLEGLKTWAATRGTGQIHRFTQALLDAVVEPNKKG